MLAEDDALLARTRALDPLIRGVAARFPLLSACTPRNAAAEQVRLLEVWRRGEERAPSWQPPEIDRTLLASARSALDDVATSLVGRAGWLAVYRERFVELSHELAAIDAAFGPRMGEAARARFAQPEVERREADLLADRFATADDDDRDADTVATDDPGDPRSLLSRMRARLSELRLPVRVLVRARVGSLAAAGDGVVIIAEGQRATPREIERVVIHEVDGHVLPRERGRGGRFGIETLGSAGASEDEEGRALLLEERHGLLSGRRRRSLAARHRAAAMVEREASYVDVVRALRSIVPLDEALSIASRVMRGGHRRGSDVVSGLARERVYLPARERVARALAAEGALLDRLASRRLSLAATHLVG
jgi:hypothetical protein